MTKDNVIYLKPKLKMKINIEERLIKVLKCRVCHHEKEPHDPSYCNYCANWTENDEVCL